MPFWNIAMVTCTGHSKGVSQRVHREDSTAACAVASLDHGDGQAGLPHAEH